MINSSKILEYLGLIEDMNCQSSNIESLIGDLEFRQNCLQDSIDELQEKLQKELSSHEDAEEFEKSYPTLNL